MNIIQCKLHDMAVNSRIHVLSVQAHPLGCQLSWTSQVEIKSSQQRWCCQEIVSRAGHKITACLLRLFGDCLLHFSATIYPDAKWPYTSLEYSMAVMQPLSAVQRLTDNKCQNDDMIFASSKYNCRHGVSRNRRELQGSPYLQLLQVV